MSATPAAEPLLFVDLDGTLVSNDTLHASLFKLLRYRPWQALLTPLWVAGGKAYFKDRVAAVATDLLGPLPYRGEVLDYVRAEVAAGRPVILATAANYRIADRVAAELGLFAAVIASDAACNLSGREKLAKIHAYCAGQPFAYIGDHPRDVPVWRAAQRAILVGPAHQLRSQLANVPEVIAL